ncbi:MAG: hypothetical protein RLZZ24_994 [Pseudomonadota bacterium]
MHTISLPEGIHLLERGWLSSNCFLLEDARANVLIDTGYWTHSDQTTQWVSSVLGHRPLQKILNTHLHSDHCGGNAALQSAYPMCETLVPPGHACHVFDWDPAALSYEPTGQHCPPFTASGVIQTGDRFDVAGMSWQAFAAPGHDPNSLIFYSPSHRLLISADALWENGFGVVFPELEGIAGFDEVANTLDLIESLDPLVVLPGHGQPFTDCTAALDRARSRLKMFRASPMKHANYASKVLLKYKLLELQQVPLNDFHDWAARCELLLLMHETHFSSQSFRDWFHQLLSELSKAKAAAVDDSTVTNV